jgi:hypothetical protein
MADMWRRNAIHRIWMAVDRYLLLHLPWIWMVRAHYLAAAAIVAWLLATLLAATYPVRPNSIPSPADHTWVMFVIAAIAAVSWFVVIFRGQLGAPVRRGAQGWLTPLGIAAGLAMLVLPAVAYTRIMDGRIASVVSPEQYRADSILFNSVELPVVFIQLKPDTASYIQTMPYAAMSWSSAEYWNGELDARPYIDQIDKDRAQAIARVGERYGRTTAEQFLAVATLQSARRRVHQYRAALESLTKDDGHLKEHVQSHLPQLLERASKLPAGARLAELVTAAGCATPACTASANFRSTYAATSSARLAELGAPDHLVRSWREFAEAAHMVDASDSTFDAMRTNIAARNERHAGHLSSASKETLFFVWLLFLVAACVFHVITQVRSQATRRVRYFLGVVAFAVAYAAFGESDEQMILTVLAPFVVFIVIVLLGWRARRANTLTVASTIGFLLMMPLLTWLVVGTLAESGDSSATHWGTAAWGGTLTLLAFSSVMQRIANRLRALPQ